MERDWDSGSGVDDGRSLADRYGDVAGFLQSRGWSGTLLPAIVSHARDLTQQLIMSDAGAIEDAGFKGQLRALKWVAEYMQLHERQLRSQMRDAETRQKQEQMPTEYGHPYGPSPQDQQPHG